MTLYKSAALLVLLGASTSTCAAFVQPTAPPGVARGSTTSLHALTPPTLIIGPMIRKMREEKAQRNMPLASDDERKGEAPGLRVGTNAWKWPPVWPYDSQAFVRKDEIAAQARQSALQGIAGMGGGMPQLPESPEAAPAPYKLDVKKYWGEEKADVSTDLEEEAANKLRSHYSYYLRDGMSVLEFGAAEESYMPENLKLSRLVGVGLSKTQLEKNPALTETLVVDLNEVDTDKGVDSDEIKKLGANTFDAVIMANTIDFLEHPREVFKSAWQLLKPGGIMMVAFTNKDSYGDKFGKAYTKMWVDMNDDQHMWIAGSFFQFSAGDGWGKLNGFDISPEGAKIDESPLEKLMNKNKAMPMYVVQARKEKQDEIIDESDPEKSFKSLMWMLPTMEDRDKILVAPRLARSFATAKSEEEKRAMGEHVQTLPKIYESLVKMDQFAFTFSMQAQLAADLARDKDFVASDDQITAMKMGLGLLTPSKEFWEPVGVATANMNPEDKVNLLAHIVPRFGSGDPEQEAALEAFVAGLKPTIATVRSKCPSMSEADAQLLGSELLAAEVLHPGKSTRKEFAAWLGALNEAELNEYLSRRKSFKETALAEMKAMQDARAAEQKRLEEERQMMIDQARKAREERTMAFNRETGKIEEIKK